MKYTFILFASLFVYSQLYTQKKNTFYIEISPEPKQGYVSLDLYADEDSIFSLILGGFPNGKPTAAFMLLCEKKFKKTNNSYLVDKKIINPVIVMDSLDKQGRLFLKNNNFYVLFKKKYSYYIHKVSLSEYLYMNYKDCEEDVLPSRITLHRIKKLNLPLDNFKPQDSALLKLKTKT